MPATPDGRRTRWAATADFEERRRRRFEQLGINLNALHPGVPMAMYHEEPGQEDFLVLEGECAADRGG